MVYFYEEVFWWFNDEDEAVVFDLAGKTESERNQNCQRSNRQQ